ncbi:MAG: alginate export family protein [Candidatus Omnitrophica bacterium]|nr:alginate export family protein [Candidatus Omnitrophota bacterium]
MKRNFLIAYGLVFILSLVPAPRGWGSEEWTEWPEELTQTESLQLNAAPIDNSNEWLVASKVVVSDSQKQQTTDEDVSWYRISGHARTRYESRQNYDFIYDRPSIDGMADNDDNFLLTRFRLSVDIEPNPYLSGRVTFQDSREFGSDVINHDALDRSGTDIFENKADLHEAYLKLRLGESPWAIQAGRMQLNYGDQRLIGGFNWGNTARNFDAAKILYQEGDFSLDLVAANVVVVDSNAWDNSNDDDDFLFAYATMRNKPQGTQDFYLLYRDNDDLNREIYTLGTRIDGACGDLDWNFEGAWQWGSSTDTVAPTAGSGEILDHKAWAASAEIGYTQSNLGCAPRLAVGYSYASGDDDPNDNENNTFDNLYPTNHLYYGYMDFFSWRNVHNPNLKLHWKASDKLTFKTHWHMFWLDEPEDDAWYNAGGGVVRNAAGNDASSFVGHELDIVASYACSEKLNMELGYGHFFAEDYVRDTSPNGREADDADFVYLMTTLTF